MTTDYVETFEEAPARPRRARWVGGVSLVVAGLALLAVWAMRSPGAVSYYVTTSEVQARGQSAYDQALRLGGRVAPASLARNGAAVAFTVTDGHHEVRVAYRGEIPDTLKEGTDVIADGRLRSDGTLVADRVVAKCSSRFVSKVEKDARAARR